MSRRNAREYALKVLYSRELNPETETIDSGELELTEKDRAFADALVKAAAEHKEIDEKISAHLTNWSLSQLNVVDKNILRLALAEFYFMGDEAEDRKLIINEAVEMAKVYGSESSYRFVNAVLDKATKG